MADGGSSTCFALRALLEQNPGWQVVGAVISGDHLMEKIDRQHPDILLLDWNLPGFKAEICIPSIRKDYPRVVIVVMSGRPELRRAVMSAGAHGFVNKTEPPGKLLETISTVSS